MHILHTSDWHLGKTIDGRYTRLPEQQAFLSELAKIAAAEQIDLIIVAGDVYDVPTPPGAAEQLFYKSMAELCANIPVLVIAGNHDNPERLTAASPLATEQGLILLGTPGSVAEVGEYNGFSIVDAGQGYVELEIRGERAVILTMAYPSEKRLNEILSVNSDEAEFQKTYSQRIGALFDELSGKFRQDTVNVVTGHFYVIGGESSNSEREIQLGGIYAVESDALPKNAQYIAMGHLHRAQSVKCAAPHAYYSGSPIQLGKSETGHAKCVYVAEIKPTCEASVKKIYLRNYKPVEVWHCKSIESALEKCERHGSENSWVFLEIETDRPVSQSEMKEMHRLKQDIIEINPIMQYEAAATQTESTEKTMAEEFADFYIAARNTPPSEEIVDLFLRLLNGDEGDML